MLKTLLQRGQTDPAQILKLVESIESTGQRIEKIVRSMKSLAHRGEEDPLYPTSVAEIVNDSLELCAQRLRNHGIRLEVATVSKDLMVECRAHEISQVLVNLVNNAHDAILNLSEKWIKIEVKDLGEKVQVSVFDSGKGIPVEHLPKLFEPFFSTKRVQYGTGLGLSISRGILLRHKGQLIYDGEEVNTCFRMELLKKVPK